MSQGRLGLSILQVMRAPVGGLFRHVADLSHGLARRGHRLGLVVDALSGDDETEDKLSRIAPDLELGIHRLAMPRLLGAGDLTAPFALRALGRRLGISVYHGHGAKGGFHARLAAPRHAGIASVYTPHGGVLHFDRKAASGRVFHALERGLMARTDAIVFESDYARQTYGRLIASPTCRTDVIHNGLRAQEFEPVDPDSDAADFVFVGELRTLKGVAVLLEALALMAGSPTLVVCGGGPDRAAFETLAADRGIADRVRFMGPGPARTAFARGKTLVVPSFNESLPYIVLEGFAAGLPVIATEVGGIPEIFGDARTALVPPRDAAALARAMDAARADPDRARSDAAPLRERLVERFSVEAMTSGIEAVYHAALETDRATAFT